MQHGGYSIEHHPHVLRDDIPKLGHVIRKRVMTVTRVKLTVDPIHYGKSLTQSLRNCRSLRIGDFRVVYQIIGSRVRILSVRHRSKGYEGIEERLEA